MSVLKRQEVLFSGLPVEFLRAAFPVSVTLAPFCLASGWVSLHCHPVLLGVVGVRESKEREPAVPFVTSEKFWNVLLFKWLEVTAKWILEHCFVSGCHVVPVFIWRVGIWKWEVNKSVSSWGRGGKHLLLSYAITISGESKLLALFVN